MPDNNPPNQETQDPPADAGQVGQAAGDDDRFAQLEKKINSIKGEAGDWKKRFEAAQKELDKFNADSAAAEERKLAEEKNWAELERKKNERIAELESQAAEKDRRLIVSEAKDKLVDLVPSPLARKAIADDWAALPETERTEENWTAFVEKQKKADPLAFDLSKPTGTQPRVRQPSGEGGSEDWAQVLKDYNSGNPQLVSAATAKASAYARQNGSPPPGFESLFG